MAMGIHDLYLNLNLKLLFILNPNCAVGAAAAAALLEMLLQCCNANEKCRVLLFRTTRKVTLSYNYKLYV
jgi:hypothetical protein